MDRAEVALFDQTLRRATESHTGAALDGALADLGWHDALNDDAHVAVALLFEHQGRAGATSSALDDVVSATLGAEAWLGTAVVLPGLDRADPPAHRDGDRLVVEGLGTARLLRSDTAVVAVGGAGGELAAVVTTPQLGCRAVSGMDPRLGLVGVAGSATPVATAAPLEPGRWSAAVRLARLALGHELVGASDAMLELARAHALERVQFGQPVAAFQAVRHRLADTLVAVESARALLDAAWEDGSDETAAMAKAVAGRSARTAARHCQQVLAGMGFTSEHPFHLFLRRVLVLDELFGATRSLTASLGRNVLDRRRLPPPFPL